MTDTLIARLRNGNLFADRVEAADRIETLQDETQELRREAANLEVKVTALTVELAAAEAGLETIDADYAVLENEELNRLRAERDEYKRVKLSLESEIVKRIDEYESRLAEQLQTIIALNNIVGGEGSLTTDNITYVSRLEAKAKSLEVRLGSMMVERSNAFFEVIQERDQLRAELGQYPEIQAMLMKENKELRAEVEALQSTPFSEEAYEILQGKNKALQARLTALEGQEPVAYEFRMRADWVPDWGLWSPCNKEHHEMYIRAPKLHDWVYETRALFLAAQVAPTKEQT